jgi:hypothetical protein
VHVQRPAAAKPKAKSDPKRKEKAHAIHKVVPPKPSVTRSLGIPSPAQATKSGGTAFLLIVASLVAAIFCFGVVSVPATIISRRAYAEFVIRRKIDMTLLGVGLLIAAFFTVYWSKQ